MNATQAATKTLAPDSPLDAAEAEQESARAEAAP